MAALSWNKLKYYCLSICRWSHSNASSSVNSLSDSCASTHPFTSFLFHSKSLSSFVRSADWSISIWSWNILLTAGLLLALICSCRKLILWIIIPSITVLKYWSLVEDDYNQASTFRGGRVSDSGKAYSYLTKSQMIFSDSGPAAINSRIAIFMGNNVVSWARLLPMPDNHRAGLACNKKSHSSHA